MLIRTAHFGLIGLVVFSLLGTAFALQDRTDSVQDELVVLIKKINSKLNQGKQTKEDLAEEIKEFDTLYKKYKDQKTSEAAMILMMKGRLFQEVFGDEETALQAFLLLKKDFPGTDTAEEAEARILSLQFRMGVEFPDFEADDIDGKPLSISQFKNKVILVDFWASWCGPCVAEMPHVVAAYKKHHDQGFEIIGISLDNSREDFMNFMKKNGMTWRQYFDGKGWQNELARKYAVNSIPATFLLGPDGKIIGKNLRGSALEEAVTEALDKR